MGIKQLSKVIGDYAADALQQKEIKNYFGRKVAIDASMSIYQFLIAVRSEGNQLMNEAGETTSHLMGIFYRTLRMMDNGIKPLYVFDGAPPTMKSGELAKRLERRKEAQEGLQKAQEDGTQEDLDKFSRRTVKVTKQHNEECKKLLSLMGVPYVDAPCEAEAQCAALVKAGLVYGAGSEDMDTLTFGANVLLRHLTFSEARKEPIVEINLAAVLRGLEFTMDQFIDLCILLGCDYTDSIRGIGPKKAVDLMQQHGSIEKILENLDTAKYQVPENWQFVEARRLFKEPLVTNFDVQFKWNAPKEEELVDFMVKEHQFAEDRIRAGIKRLQSSRTGVTQQRLDSFFTTVPSAAPKKQAKPVKAAKGSKPMQKKEAAKKEVVKKETVKKEVQKRKAPSTDKPQKKSKPDIDDFVVPDHEEQVSEAEKSEDENSDDKKLNLKKRQAIVSSDEE